jgi:hypothetical protein
VRAKELFQRVVGHESLLFSPGYGSAGPGLGRGL